MGRQVAMLAATALLVAGCAPHPPPPVLHHNADIRIALTTQPPEPRQLDPTRFTATLRDAQGRPIRNAMAQISLQMTTMDMGQNVVSLSYQSHGIYTGTGRFTMSGAWRITVTATVGSQRAVQAFFVTVR